MIRNRNNHPGPVEVGGLRSQDYCTHTFEYDLAITRAYHQIHAEALEVFERENHWVRVQTNKAGFGRALKDRGYGVVCGQEPKNPQTEDLIHDDCELA